MGAAPSNLPPLHPAPVTPPLPACPLHKLGNSAQSRGRQWAVETSAPCGAGPQEAQEEEEVKKEIMDERKTVPGSEEDTGSAGEGTSLLWKPEREATDGKGTGREATLRGVGWGVGRAAQGTLGPMSRVLLP